ncbi:hypothetical protein ADL21_11350 [Streptomyces albus subsp. albus]|nr:hypothetical protein ADL21_11350 [Streptomyces albus subsp. albus]
MNPSEARKLLAHCAVFDHRRPSVAAAEGWAAALHDVPLDADALAAVARFYGTPPADPGQRRWIEPHHVRSLRADLRSARTTAAGEAPGPGLPVTEPDADPDDVPAYLAALRQQRTRAADSTSVHRRPVRELVAQVGRSAEASSPYLPEPARTELGTSVPAFASRYERWPELTVSCPKTDCRAPARRPCVTPSGRELREHTHPSRRAAWATAATGCPACQAPAGAPCRDRRGRVLPDLLHTQRHREAAASWPATPAPPAGRADAPRR